MGHLVRTVYDRMIGLALFVFTGPLLAETETGFFRRSTPRMRGASATRVEVTANIPRR